MKSKLRGKMNYSKPHCAADANRQQNSIDSIHDYDNSFMDCGNSVTRSHFGGPKRAKTKEPSPAQTRVFGVQPGEAVELTKEDTIPARALRQTLDKTHEMLKEWKQD